MLKTDFEDDILDPSMEGRRRYELLENADGTFSLVDKTKYSKLGSQYSANEINEANTEINALNESLMLDYSNASVDNLHDFLQLALNKICPKRFTLFEDGVIAEGYSLTGFWSVNSTDKAIVAYRSDNSHYSGSILPKINVGNCKKITAIASSTGTSSDSLTLYMRDSSGGGQNLVFTSSNYTTLSCDITPNSELTIDATINTNGVTGKIKSIILE